MCAFIDAAAAAAAAAAVAVVALTWKGVRPAGVCLRTISIGSLLATQQFDVIKNV